MALDLTSPLDISLAPVAFGLDTLANLLVFVLGCPEWSQPWGYTRSDYKAEEFCQYILRWILDGNDKIIACLILFGLPIVAKRLLRFIQSPNGQTADLQSALDTRNQESRQATHKNRDLESQNSSLEEQIRNNATTSAETITALQSQNNDLKMKLSAEQEAKQRESEKASSAAAEMDAQMKRLSQETEILRQRAEKAEKALHEKGNAMKTAEQKQQQLESRINTAAERIEKLEEEAEEHQSEQAALQDRAETAESNEHTFKNELKSSESKRQTLQDKLDTTRKELSQITRKSNKAADDVSTLRKELTTTNQAINSKEAECKALKDDNNATKQRCTELEKENKAFNVAKKQQHEADSKLKNKLEQAERKLKESTEREDKLNRMHSSDKNSFQEQLKRANSEIQKLSEESRVADLKNTKLAERCDKADGAVEQAKKLQQESQSKTQEVQETLKNCQQALKQKTEAKDKQSIDHNLALEAKDKELKEVVRSNKANIEKLETCKIEATERTADNDKRMARAQAELEILQDEMDLKSSTIGSLELELRLTSVEIAEAKDIVQLLESKKWHEYAKMQEAWILESYAIIEDQLEQAESRIQVLEVNLEGLAEEHHVALEEKDKAFANQMRQYEEAVGKVDEDLEAYDAHEANRTPREPMERETELDYEIEPTNIAALEDDFAAESEIEDLEGEGTVYEDEQNDTSSQHGSSQGESDGEDNEVSQPSQIDNDDNGNSEIASHGDFDRLAVDQQRKLRRRVNNQDMNKGGTGAKVRRKNQRAQAQQVLHEQQAPVAAANDLLPATDGRNLLQPSQQQAVGHGGRQHQASAQHWNDFANAAQQDHDNQFGPPQQPAVQMPVSRPRFQAPNGFGGRRGRRGLGRW